MQCTVCSVEARHARSKPVVGADEVPRMSTETQRVHAVSVRSHIASADRMHDIQQYTQQKERRFPGSSHVRGPTGPLQPSGVVDISVPAAGADRAEVAGLAPRLKLGRRWLTVRTGIASAMHALCCGAGRSSQQPGRRPRWSGCNRRPLFALCVRVTPGSDVS